MIKQIFMNKINYITLPPYSPQLNPIELAWAKAKFYFRK